MSPAQKVIQCGICGHKMVIPPGFENAVGQCRICGGPVSASQSPPASRLEETMRAARPKPKKSAPSLREVKAAFLHGLVGGIIGAILGGIISTAIMFLTRTKGSELTIGSLFASSDNGLLAGFVICSSWAIIRRLSLGPIRGMIVGASIGVTLGVLMHVLENILVAPQDLPLPLLALIALIAGGVVGFILGEKVGSDDD